LGHTVGHFFTYAVSIRAKRGRLVPNRREAKTVFIERIKMGPVALEAHLDGRDTLYSECVINKLFLDRDGKCGRQFTYLDGRDTSYSECVINKLFLDRDGKYGRQFTYTFPYSCRIHVYRLG